jgi:hypothetical protein
MSLGYAWEKFYAMILGVSRLEGPLQRRLLEAYRHSLIRLREEDIHDDLRQDFTEIMAALSDIARTEAAGGSPEDVSRMMGEVEASRLVDRILSMYTTLTRRYEYELPHEEDWGKNRPK